MDTTPVSTNGLAKYYRIDGPKLQRQYKEHLSGYRDWDQLAHAKDWILFGNNLGAHICIDEGALSQGELYTVVTNGSAGCQSGSLIAMVRDTRSDQVIEILKKIPLQKRKQVKEVTVDLAASMNKVAPQRASAPFFRTEYMRQCVVESLSQPCVIWIYFILFIKSRC